MNGEGGNTELWDIDAIQLRIGPMHTDKSPDIMSGNKYVIVEELADPEGHPLQSETFDYRNMCYTVLTAPRAVKFHQGILEYNRDHGFISPTGNVVGGGTLWVYEDDELYTLSGFSAKFLAEPPLIRKKISDLIEPSIIDTFGEKKWRNRPESNWRPTFYNEYTANYWLRFRQVAESSQCMS